MDNVETEVMGERTEEQLRKTMHYIQRDNEIPINKLTNQQMPNLILHGEEASQRFAKWRERLKAYGQVNGEVWGANSPTPEEAGAGDRPGEPEVINIQRADTGDWIGVKPEETEADKETGAPMQSLALLWNSKGGDMEGRREAGEMSSPAGLHQAAARRPSPLGNMWPEDTIWILESIEREGFRTIPIAFSIREVRANFAGLWRAPPLISGHNITRLPWEGAVKTQQGLARQDARALIWDPLRRRQIQPPRGHRNMRKVADVNAWATGATGRSTLMGGPNGGPLDPDAPLRAAIAEAGWNCVCMENQDQRGTLDAQGNLIDPHGGEDIWSAEVVVKGSNTSILIRANRERTIAAVEGMIGHAMSYHTGQRSETLEVNEGTVAIRFPRWTVGGEAGIPVNPGLTLDEVDLIQLHTSSKSASLSAQGKKGRGCGTSSGWVSISIRWRSGQEKEELVLPDNMTGEEVAEVLERRNSAPPRHNFLLFKEDGTRWQQGQSADYPRRMKCMEVRVVLDGPAGARRNREEESEEGAGDAGSSTGQPDEPVTGDLPSYRVYGYGDEGTSGEGWSCLYRNVQTTLAWGAVRKLAVYPVPSLDDLQFAHGIQPRTRSIGSEADRRITIQDAADLIHRFSNGNVVQRFMFWEQQSGNSTEWIAGEVKHHLEAGGGPVTTTVAGQSFLTAKTKGHHQGRLYLILDPHVAHGYDPNEVVAYGDQASATGRLKWRPISWMLSKARPEARTESSSRCPTRSHCSLPECSVPSGTNSAMRYTEGPTAASFRPAEMHLAAPPWTSTSSMNSPTRPRTRP